MLISEIEPIGNAGVNLLQQEGMDMIDTIVELPLRSACKLFREKGIETVMSSANKNNILRSGEKVIEKEDVYGTIEHRFETYTFLEAGVGYAWIMINFDSLSDENKDLIFRLEEKIGENRIWFVHPAEMDGNIEFALKIGKYDYEFVRQALDEADIPQNIEVDPRLVEFEKRHICLMYPWEDSSSQAIFLRMPLYEKTTVDEVESYFVEFAKCFQDQTKSVKFEDEKKDNSKGLNKI